eukprot:3718293-Pleurochrysis_carterae.AAC.2
MGVRHQQRGGGGNENQDCMATCSGLLVSRAAAFHGRGLEQGTRETKATAFKEVQAAKLICAGASGIVRSPLQRVELATTTLHGWHTGFGACIRPHTNLRAARSQATPLAELRRLKQEPLLSIHICVHCLLHACKTPLSRAHDR